MFPAPDWSIPAPENAGNRPFPAPENANQGERSFMLVNPPNQDQVDLL